MLESFGVMNAGLYALGALALVLAPGPNSIFVFKTSIQYGSKPAFHAALAVFLGDAALIFLAYPFAIHFVFRGCFYKYTI